MKHLLVTFLLLGISVNIFSQSHNPYLPSPEPDRIILSWNADPATTMSVSWRTDSSCTVAYAELALASPDPSFVEDVDRIEASTERLQLKAQTSHHHSATFTGLFPGTQYAYRVGQEDAWSEWFHFTTAESGAEPFSFIYFGDAQNDLKSLWSRTIRAAYSDFATVDFMLHAGDLVNNCMFDHEWGDWFYAGGWVYGMLPSIASPGNHEYFKDYLDPAHKKRLSALWNPTFEFPLNGPKGLEETVYYLDYQGTRFISLNSEAAIQDPAMLDIQVRWLDSVLAQTDAAWTIVTIHHPMYSTKQGRDNPALRKAFQPLFEAYEVDLVLQGHDHTYGRGRNIPIGKKQKGHAGPVYVVSVSGPKMYDLGLDKWMERGASNTQLYQVIRVAPQKLEYEAYMVTGELYDAFDLIKDKKGPAEFIDKAPKETPERLDLPEDYKRSFSDSQLDEYNRRFKAYKRRNGHRGK